MNGRIRFLRPVALLLLAALLALQPLAALAEAAAETNASESAVQYYAYTTVAQKIRKAPDKKSGGAGSLKAGETVYIIEIVDDDWVQIQFSRGTGYAQRQYLTEITPYDGSAIAEYTPEDSFAQGAKDFREAYVTYAYRSTGLHLEPDKKSRWIKTVLTYEKVIVSEVDGDWCYARFNNQYGYILCEDLFMWDRLVPDAGIIPGLDIMPLLAFTKRSTDIYDLKTNKVLKTINPGAGLAVFEKDGMGRYTLPYWRTTGYIKEEDVAYTVKVADYNAAQPGELISVMSTYYAVGISTLQYQGRNWNIHLASSMISGVVLQPGEDYDQYQVIGPYRKSTGYHPAPIMKTGALWGYGGGTCQVNTTFYMANMQVPILVTYRKVHANVGIYYAKVGFDAAVGGGDINLTLTNTMPYSIRYQFYDSDGVLTCAIYRES